MANNKTIWIIAAVAALLFIPLGGAGGSYAGVLMEFIPAVEGFSATPVWDYKQWSWGYGTAAGYDRYNKPTGTITREKALQDAIAVNDANYRTIRPRFTRSLKGHEMAAMLSLAYNLGPARIDVFAPFVNAGDTAGLFAKMRAYVYAGGVRNQGLVNRREKEILLYSGQWSTSSGRTASEAIYWEPSPAEWITPELITDEYGN
jgi:GH24 family phage-related lysozyme (muramidase)